MRRWCLWLAALTVCVFAVPPTGRAVDAAPLISLTASRASVGDSIAIAGAGFSRSIRVSGCLAAADGGCLADLFSVETQTDGSFIGPFTVPDVPIGTYSVLVRGDGPEQRASLVVVESVALVPERIAVSVALRPVGAFLIGGQGEYEITLTNRGAQWAPTPISATLWLPEGMGWAGADAPEWRCAGATGEAMTTCVRLIQLAPGEHTTIRAFVSLNEYAYGQATARVSITVPGNRGDLNEARATTFVEFPVLP